LKDARLSTGFGDEAIQGSQGIARHLWIATPSLALGLAMTNNRERAKGCSVAIDAHAAAGSNVGCAFGKGLKVEAIRKAPIPIAQEPM
jgi:hypothetical protein